MWEIEAVNLNVIVNVDKNIDVNVDKNVDDMKN